MAYYLLFVVVRYHIVLSYSSKLFKSGSVNPTHESVSVSLELSEIYKALNRIPGVMDTVDVKINSVSGGKYSSVPLNTDLYMSSDGSKLYVPDDHILELKYPNADITGVVE